MKTTGTCPKCGGQDIAVMRGDLNVKSDPRVRTAGGFFVSYEDFLPVTQYLCCTCGYLESWADPEKFVREGGRTYWERREREEQELDENDAYWKEKLREKREKEAQEERAKDKRTNRREDPWT